MTKLWVFGYGSLMWRPGFPFLDAQRATLAGAHRSLCVYSWVHRGTKEHPGLVLGLDRGGSCRGIAYCVAPEHGDDVLTYLRGRELVTNVYREVIRPVRLEMEGSPTVNAVTYVVDRRHPQYAGDLPWEVRLDMIRGNHGVSGANRDYVLSTVAELRTLGIKDASLEWLAARLEEPEDASGGKPAIAAGEVGGDREAGARRGRQEMNEGD